MRAFDSRRSLRDSHPVGCDTMVALAGATRDGRAIFAKNSDRPPRECQGVVRVERRRHAPGARVPCQYLEVPQVDETHAIVGSQPHWLWGLEHGVNEHGLAIGNEMVFTREALGPTGLLGMDLVRLGLERARSAAEAVHVVTTLIERHGQGGSGQPHTEWRYSNAFLLADAGEAWVLETSGRQWAARRVEAVANISNGLALGTDWTRASDDVARHAVARGWWPAGDDRLDFAAAYADPAVPAMVACPRRERAAALLSQARGEVSDATMRAILRDHHDLGPVHRRRAPDDPNFFTLCMHADPLDNTTASMVATLPAEPDEVRAIWVSLGSPCVGTFCPVYFQGVLPAALGPGGGEPDEALLWWRLRDLLTLVEEDPERRAPWARTRWDAVERDVVRRVAAADAEATELRRRGDAAALESLLTRTMDEAVRAALAVADELRHAFRRRP